MHQKLDRLFAGLVKKPDVRNSLMAVDAPRLGLAWRGYADHLSADSQYCIASCTKLYTAALVIQLLETGEISLSDPAHELLPDNLMEGLAVIDGKDVSRDITVQHLLSNTSGLLDYFEDKPRGGTSLFEDIVGGDDTGWSTTDALARARGLTPRFAPGTPGKAHYSDTNFQLLGEILRAVTGKGFERLVTERISERIGQTATYVFGPDTADRYSSIVPISAGAKVLDIPNTMASLGAQGGVISTLGDSLNFLKAFMDGKLFGREWIDQLKAEWNPVFFPLRYGMGMMKFDVHPAFTMFRRVPPLYGHSGSTGVVMYHCPERDIWMCGAVNQTGARSLPHQFMLRTVMALG